MPLLFYALNDVTGTRVRCDRIIEDVKVKFEVVCIVLQRQENEQAPARDALSETAEVATPTAPQDSIICDWCDCRVTVCHFHACRIL